MVFIRGLILALSLILVACSQNATKTQQAEQKTTYARVDLDGEDFTPLPNPYTANPRSVPGRAKQEFNQALAAIKAGKWEDAEGILNLMTQTYPKLSGPYANLGIVYTHLERLDDAQKALEFAISVNEYNMDAYTELGRVLRKQGRFDEAEANYQRALLIWPHHIESHRNLGVLYDLYMGRFEDALYHYKFVAKLQQPEPDKEIRGWIIDLERRMAENE